MANTFLLTETSVLDQNNQNQNQINDNAFIKQQTQQIFSNYQPQQQIEKKNENKSLRIWNTILNKISFTPPDDEFFASFPIKPGFYFFQAISNCKSQLQSPVTFKIPYTLIPYESSHIMIYAEDTLQLQSEVSWLEFEKRLIESNKNLCQLLQQQSLIKYRISCIDKTTFNNNYQKQIIDKLNYQLTEDAPFLIQRGVEQGLRINECAKVIYSAKQHKERKQSQLFGEKIEQQYIFTPHLKSEITRFCYYTKSAKEMKNSFAYRLTNKQGIFDQPKNSSITNRAAINSQSMDSYTVQDMKGGSLQPFIDMAEQIVQILNKNYSVRITQIVLDFIQDVQGKIWLINCKFINMEPAISMAMILHKKRSQSCSTDIIGRNEMLDQLTCSVYCKLCGLIFKKDDAQKTLTNKILWELIQHLQKRNIQLNWIKEPLNSATQCKVCNICYLLAVSEYELVDTEQRFASKMHIKISDPLNRVISRDQLPRYRPALLPKKLYQWRIMLYYTEINGIPQEQQLDWRNLNLQYKLYTNKVSFRIIALPEQQQRQLQDNSKNLQRFVRSQSSHGRINNAHSNSDVSGANKSQFTKFNVSKTQLNLMRIHYFFSETENVNKFLKESIIKIRLTEGHDWNNFLAEGCTNTLSTFRPGETVGQQHSCQILLFFQDSQYCNLLLTAGLVCDGPFDTQNINLYKVNQCYLPDDSFYNLNPLPDEWMEIFDIGYLARKEEIIAKQQACYSPKCSVKELDSMIGLSNDKQERTIRSKKDQSDEKVHMQKIQSQFNLQTQQAQKAENALMAKCKQEIKQKMITQKSFNMLAQNIMNTTNNYNAVTTTQDCSSIMKANDNQKLDIDHTQINNANNISTSFNFQKNKKKIYENNNQSLQSIQQKKTHLRSHSAKRLERTVSANIQNSLSQNLLSNSLKREIYQDKDNYSLSDIQANSKLIQQNNYFMEEVEEKNEKDINNKNILEEILSSDTNKFQYKNIKNIKEPKNNIINH